MDLLEIVHWSNFFTLSPIERLTTPMTACLGEECILMGLPVVMPNTDAVRSESLGQCLRISVYSVIRDALFFPGVFPWLDSIAWVLGPLICWIPFFLIQVIILYRWSNGVQMSHVFRRQDVGAKSIKGTYRISGQKLPRYSVRSA